MKVLEAAGDSLADGDKEKESSASCFPDSVFIHTSSTVDSSAHIGEGTNIWNFSNIQKNARIGENCILGQNVNIGPNVVIGNRCKIQNNVSVYEGVELEDYVFCGPSMVFTNIQMPRSKYPQAESKFYKKTLIKEGSSIGAPSSCLSGIVNVFDLSAI